MYHFTDVVKQETIDKAKSLVESVVKDEGLNLLINNSGRLCREGLETATREEMRTHFEINAIGPLMMVQVFEFVTNLILKLEYLHYNTTFH